jgi:hypothetical protein
MVRTSIYSGRGRQRFASGGDDGAEAPEGPCAVSSVEHVFENLVGRDGIKPPTPGFSDLSLEIANDAEVLGS